MYIIWEFEKQKNLYFSAIGVPCTVDLNMKKGLLPRGQY